MAYEFSGWKPNFTVKAIDEFIVKEDHRFNGALSRVFSYPRVVSLHDFFQCINHFNLSLQESVGIFSGSLNEPELKFIDTTNITLLNFEESDAFDLDRSWADQEPRNFSFSLCNQVLEHIFSPHTALKNITHHTRSGGYIFISIPTINCIHSDPYFYSSGYHPRFLERLATENNLTPISINNWGSYKYMMNAVSGKWLTSKQLQPGVHGLRDLLIPFSILQDGRKKSETYITDCWGLFQKC
ncbi:hypothetical protein BCM14_1484 [Jezberella montanilacus]|uniref:Methyltransferase type 11 domain-containing protein n=1 Tax=Jezberella montanilacus TaxID=323426 RepID=A0A2T0XIA4_9BURK|nr:hypothetical protein [Jezberella montanilacus]PRY98651.1 hypothetical protein BCM14_1484 [Jezberella montanilacus]